MSPTAFYLVFVVGLTLLTVAGGFAFAAFAMTQGEFQATTRRGLASLLVTLLVTAAVLGSSLSLNHLHLAR